MTFAEMIQMQTGYKCMTTFTIDFAIAEKFGLAAVADTFKRAFKEWRNNVKYLTELVLVLNHKIWYWYTRNDKLARLYDKCWREADEWAREHLEGEDAAYYYKTLD